MEQAIQLLLSEESLVGSPLLTVLEATPLEILEQIVLEQRLLQDKALKRRLKRILPLFEDYEFIASNLVKEMKYPPEDLRIFSSEHFGRIFLLSGPFEGVKLIINNMYKERMGGGIPLHIGSSTVIVERFTATWEWVFDNPNLPKGYFTIYQGWENVGFRSEELLHLIHLSYGPKSLFFGKDS